MEQHVAGTRAIPRAYLAFTIRLILGRMKCITSGILTMSVYVYDAAPYVPVVGVIGFQILYYQSAEGLPPLFQRLH